MEWIEAEAKQLLKDSRDEAELKKFLRKVPWHEIQLNGRTRTIASQQPAVDAKPSAYLMFGMYSHGGVVGVTRVSHQFPWLTQVLTRVVKLTQPEHSFTTIAISCNVAVEPHRDSWNARQVPNLVIPLQYPEKGGEVWVAKPPGPNQVGHSLLCNGKETAGSLQSLKKAFLIDPHMWHASMPWSGTRTLMVAFALQAVHKLEPPSVRELKTLGFALDPRRFLRLLFALSCLG